MKYMLDTNICIYAIKKNPQVLKRIQQEQGSGLCISSITLAELEYGAAKSAAPERNRLSIMRLLFILDILPFGQRAALDYAEIRAELERNGTPIGPLDMLLAGHARSEGLTFVTNNTREFQRVSGLSLDNWTQ